MDPYLEASWGDVHARLIVYASEQLQDRLPKGLRVRAEARLVVDSAEAPPRSIRPDLFVSGPPLDRPRRKLAPNVEGIGVALAEPLRFLIGDEPETQTYLEILDGNSGRRVVTSLEILSPSNKTPGLGRDLSLRKQRELAERGVHSVEIDLLRGGSRVLAVAEESIPPSHRTAYATWVRRADGAFDYFRAPLRKRLPVIPIPLRPGDPDVALDLQELVDRCYRSGAYGEDLDYRAEPVPPLAPDDASWADALLRERGLRPARAEPSP